MKSIPFEGKNYSVKDLSTLTGIKYTTLWSRIKRGNPIIKEDKDTLQKIGDYFKISRQRVHAKLKSGFKLKKIPGGWEWEK